MISLCRGEEIMPRQARRKSCTGIYHVMVRGINGQVIFEDEEDCLRLINTLKIYKAVSGYRLLAYCLMGNHFHLLIKVEIEDLDLIFKRVAGSYVYWYNLKYRRTGHLFQDRYKSETVEDERYFLTALRYIHQNPINAGICKDISDYKYSSYNDFVEGNSDLVDIDYIFSIINREEFILFNNEKNDDKCLEIGGKGYRLNDSDARAIIRKITKCSNATEFQSLENETRDKYIVELRKNGLSIRQISRLTGISFTIVRR